MSQSPNPLTYAAAGVDYDLLDAFKRECQTAASATVGALAALGLKEPAEVRGDSAYLVETADGFIAHVEEGLGTKNLVADAVLATTGASHYRAIGIDLVATIVNDLITCGARPAIVAMHAAVGSAQWFAHEKRRQDLAAGFAEGCRLAGAVWGGGETPSLKGLVANDAIVLGGSAIGLIQPKARRIMGDIQDGDAIVLVASNGVHANGLTLCRQIAATLPAGYMAPITPDGPSYGQGLLAPRGIYAPLVAACQDSGLPIHYAIHVTGHGWRKLMRAEANMVYRVTNPGEPPPLFKFLMKAGPIAPKEAWGTFNMGVGFALIMPQASAAQAVQLAAQAGLKAWIGGDVASEGGRKAVEIPSLGLVWEADTLAVR